MHTPPSPTTMPADGDDLVSAYEELRRQFLSRQQGPGLALLMRGGLGEWMNAYSLFTAPASITVLTTTNDAAVIADGVRTEVILILAGMLLHGYQEPCP